MNTEVKNKEYSATITKVTFPHEGKSEEFSKKILWLNAHFSVANEENTIYGVKLPFVLTEKGYIKVICAPEGLVDTILELVERKYHGVLTFSPEELKELKDSMVIELAGGYHPVLEHTFLKKKSLGHHYETTTQ